MSCLSVQNELLGLEEPSSPPAPVREHLAGCSACREWQRRLVQLERNVPLLPVPPSQGRVRLLRRLLRIDSEPAKPKASALTDSDEVVSTVDTPGPLQAAAPASGDGVGLRAPVPPVPASKRPLGIPRKARGYMAYGAAALAACLVVVIAWRGPRPALQMETEKSVVPVRLAPDPLLAQVVRCDLRLAEAQGLEQRLEALADLADDMDVEARPLVRLGAVDDLAELGRLYQKVVGGIVDGARALPRGERTRVLRPLADRLADTGKLARLPSMRLAARAGEQQLRALIGEKVR
jgi:hypothetical protein